MKRRLGLTLLALALCLTWAAADEVVLLAPARLRDPALLSADWDGDTLYGLLADGTVWRCIPGGEAERLCDAEGLDCIAVGNGGLWGFALGDGRWGRVGAEGVHWEDAALDFAPLTPEGGEGPNSVLRALLRGETLCLLVRLEEYADEEFALYAVSLADGRCRRVDIPGLRGVCPGPEGGLLCLRREDGEYWLSLCDPVSGALRETSLVDLPLDEENAGGLAWDAGEDAVLLSAYGKVWRRPSGGAFQAFAPLDTDLLENCAPAWALPDGRYALQDGGVRVCAARAPRRQLRVSGYIRLEQEALFREACPDIELRCVDRVTAEELAARLATQDDSVDVYILKADYAFTVMKEKGFAAPLASDTLGALAAKMDERIRAVVCDERGAPLAWPYDLRVWRLGLNTGYWRLFWPERPLPATFDELLDAWLDYEARLAQDYPGVGFIDHEFDYASLAYDLVSEFVMQHDADGLPDLGAPSLRRALEKLAAIRETRLALGRSTSGDERDLQIEVDSETGPGFVFWRTLTAPIADEDRVYNQLSEDFLYGLPKGKTTALPIVFDADAVPQTSVWMDVLVPNPFSARRDDALRFIECMAGKEADPQTWYALYPGENEPYEDPLYPAWREAYLLAREEAESALRAAEDEGVAPDPDLEYKLRYYTDWLANENERWAVSPQALAAFRETTRQAPLNAHAASPYVGEAGSDAWRIVMDACRRYAEGQLSIDRFLEEISSRMAMIYWEGR